MTVASLSTRTKPHLSCRRSALDLAKSAFDAHDSLELFHQLQAADGEYWLVGGAVRDAIQDINPPSDLDLVVPNDDLLIHSLLAQFGPGIRNRHGNYRYCIADGKHIDIIEPRFFYRDFTSASDVVAFFDASVNALGVRLKDGRVLDPLGGYADLKLAQTFLPPRRWKAMSDFESVHLVMRLLRLVERCTLRVTNPGLLSEQVPKLKRVDWSDLERLNGFGFDEAWRRVDRLLSDHGLRGGSIV